MSVARTLLVLVSIASAAPAYAFEAGANFDQDPIQQDGGGKLAFDGSPRFTGHTCEVCHTNAPHQVGLQLQSDDTSLFDTGWSSRKQYHMRVVLLNEHAALDAQKLGDNCGGDPDYKRCDDNGFALEIDDVTGVPAGKYVPVVNNTCANTGTIPTDVDAIAIADGTAVAHVGAHHGVTSWDFCWTAPAAGGGVLVAYVAAVDGNGGDGTTNFPNDTIGDDVATGQLLIPENGGGPPPVQSGGCSTSGDASLAGAAIVLALVMLRRRVLAALLACAALAGCVHVRPRERETLAKRNMKFAPDPIEDELDLHMQESREGAAGGYGSSGGGCGCN